MESRYKNSLKIQSWGLELDNFLIDDPHIRNFFDDIQEKDGYDESKLRDQLISLLYLGVMTSNSIRVSDKVDYVDESFKSLKQDMQHLIENKFSDSMKNKLNSFLEIDLGLHS